MEKSKIKTVDNSFIPVKERIKIRNRQIVALYKAKMSIDDVCSAMLKLGYQVSRTTVFFAINGRWTKEAKERRQIRNRLKKSVY